MELLDRVIGIPDHPDFAVKPSLYAHLTKVIGFNDIPVDVTELEGLTRLH
jgi:hypothetical protein